MNNAGIASTMSTIRIRMASVTPPQKPLMAPHMTPKDVLMTATARPISMELWPATISRPSTSNPT